MHSQSVRDMIKKKSDKIEKEIIYCSGSFHYIKYKILGKIASNAFI